MNAYRLPAAVLALLLTTAACTVGRTAQGSAGAIELRAVLAADSLWARNYATHDTATALALMSPDFFMTASNGSTKDRAMELGDIRPTTGLRMSYFRTEQVRARVYENAAVVTGVATWAFEMNGRPATNRRRYTATYVSSGPLGLQLVALHMGRAE
jgi:hypothetical protein